MLQEKFLPNRNVHSIVAIATKDMSTIKSSTGVTQVSPHGAIFLVHHSGLLAYVHSKIGRLLPSFPDCLTNFRVNP
jgi:hypothetical protein